MCGIALIVAGVRMDFSSLTPDTPPSLPPAQLKSASSFSVNELKSALRRRGPDSLASKKVKLVGGLAHLSAGGDELVVEEEEDDCSSGGELYFIGATLQLRGTRRVMQPFVDCSRNVLVFNGEVFGGVGVGRDDNDSEVLMQTLENCCSSSGEGKSSVLEVLSLIKGPWAIIYWQESSRTLWFGRDAFGRRSLLVHWPNEMDSRFLLSSVSPMSSADQSSGI